MNARPSGATRKMGHLQHLGWGRNEKRSHDWCIDALASSASAFAVGFSNARFVNGTHFSNGTPFTFAAPGSVGDKPTSCRIIILNPTLPNSGTPLSASIMNDSRAGIENRWVDAMWEFVLFSTVLSAADRQTLERNQGNFYGITVA